MPDQENNNKEKPQSFIDWIKHAFTIEKYDESSLSEREKEVLKQIAHRIHERRLTAPAIWMLDSQKHMNWLASQAMVVVQPGVELIHPFLEFITKKAGIHIKIEDYEALSSALEKRFSIEYFCQQLEALAGNDYNVGSTDTEEETPTED